MTVLHKEYVETVAGYPVSDEEAIEFLQDLNEFYSVQFDVIDDEGFLVTKISNFETVKAAMEFVRRLDRKGLIT